MLLQFEFFSGTLSPVREGQQNFKGPRTTFQKRAGETIPIKSASRSAAGT